MDAVMRQGRITELNSAACVAPLNSFDGDDRNILVQGDVVGLRRVKGERAMVVLGDVLGEEDSLCRIEVAGDVIVAGRIEWAQVIAENILVGDSVTQSQLTAAGRIRIEAGIDNTSIEAGNFDGVRKRIESLVARIDRGKEVVESLVRRVGQDEKRMAKACRTLRVPLDFSVGRIVTPAQRKISVDLTSFYA